MSGWVIHDLGGIDLRFVDVSTSDYLVEETSNPPEERLDERYVTLNDGPGARLASFNIGEAPFVIDLICIGSTRAAADANRDALQDTIDAAINGSEILYRYQQDASQPGPEEWRVLGGKVRPRWKTGQNETIFSVGGRWFSLARVILTLSRG